MNYCREQIQKILKHINPEAINKFEYGNVFIQNSEKKDKITISETISPSTVKIQNENEKVDTLQKKEINLNDYPDWVKERLLK